MAFAGLFRISIGLGCAALAISTLANVSSRELVAIWPKGTDGVDTTIPEAIKTNRPGIIQNVHNPTLTVFRPEQPLGTAVVICPGGGYGVLSTINEGYQVAERLNQAGITAFVLKYRLPNTPGADFKHPVPLSDALRAIQWVRHHAPEYGLDPNRIGIMGFSAGGHLAASASTLYDRYQFGRDEISRVSDRPDFACLGYAVISTQPEIAHGCVRAPLRPGFSPQQLAEMSCEGNVNEQTPPTFLFHSRNDRGVVPENSILMYEALNQHDVPAHLVLFSQGGHGYGLGREDHDASQWPKKFLAWLRQQNLFSLETEFFTPPGDRNGLSAASDAAAGLPNVLIIGDSISIGYTQPVIDRMKGKANVQRIRVNAGDTKRGLESLENWLGNTQWDVIHFNWGLHDLCYRHPDAKAYGNRDKVNGTQSVPLEPYRKNLEELVLRLKKTGARLVWASTTVVPEGEVGRVAGDELRYNEAAGVIMKKHGVAVNDLHALSASFSPALFRKPGDVHYTPDGSTRLAEQVAQAIESVLP